MPANARASSGMVIVPNHGFELAALALRRVVVPRARCRSRVGYGRSVMHPLSPAPLSDASSAKQSPSHASASGASVTGIASPARAPGSFFFVMLISSAETATTGAAVGLLLLPRRTSRRTADHSASAR